MSLTSIISSHISSLYGNIDFTITLSAPPKSELGEYCFGVFPLAKPLGKAPWVIAEEIATKLREDTDNFTQANVVGGYVNFSATAKIWLDIFEQVRKSTDQKSSNGETIVVDYIGANVGKPLHIGHICTPSIGQAIINTHRHLGYHVIGDSHFGDWGGIFGKLIYQWRKTSYVNVFSVTWWERKRINTDVFNRDKLENPDYYTLDVSFLVLLYQEFHKNTTEADEAEAREEFKYLSWVGIDLSNHEEKAHHEENVELWKKFTSISITESEKKLDLLNVHATYNIGESFYEWLWLPRPNGEDYPDLQYTMKNVVKELIEKWVATQNEDGSVWVSFPEESKIPSCILQKKDGTGLYLTSDLAAIKYRLTNGWNPSKLIYSVDVRQQLHLKQAFTIAKKAWPELTGWVEFFHAFNGFIKLKEWAMSTRHGTVIFLEALITEGFERIEKILAEKWRVGDKALSKADIQDITVSAIKYSYLAQDREKDVTFDWDKALSFEGNSGPYIQYAAVRAKKIGSMLEEKWYDFSSVTWLSEYDTALIRTLAEMEGVIENTAKTYKPHHLALYAYDLAVCFNSFYVHTPKILDEEDIMFRSLRLALVRQTAEQIELAFRLLGMRIPSEM